MRRKPKDELVHFLSDLYSMELQALVQMEKAPDLAKVPELARDFQIHCSETEQQVDRVRTELEAMGGSSSSIKNAVMKLGGRAFLLFARTQPETPGKLLAHAYSYEAMEWAAYDVLVRLADFAGEPSAAKLGREIQVEERTMMERLEQHFDAAEEFSHRDISSDEIPDLVCKHLAEAHALEMQSIQLLKKAPEIAGSGTLARIYAEHLEESGRQADEVEKRLRALGGKPSLVEDAALRLGALNWGAFFSAQSDTPAKLAAFAYAVEHLEIAGYELLYRTARRAGDMETEQLCQRILLEEREMTVRLERAFEQSVSSTVDVRYG